METSRKLLDSRKSHASVYNLYAKFKVNELTLFVQSKSNVKILIFKMYITKTAYEELKNWVDLETCDDEMLKILVHHCWVIIAQQNFSTVDKFFQKR